MVDLGYSFRSPKYELTISDGDPVHGPGLYVFLFFLYPRVLPDTRGPVPNTRGPVPNTRGPVPNTRGPAGYPIY